MLHQFRPRVRSPEFWPPAGAIVRESSGDENSAPIVGLDVVSLASLIDYFLAKSGLLRLQAIDFCLESSQLGLI